jgi:hypothetical protein
VCKTVAITQKVKFPSRCGVNYQKSSSPFSICFAICPDNITLRTGTANLLLDTRNINKIMFLSQSFKNNLPSLKNYLSS